MIIKFDVVKMILWTWRDAKGWRQMKKVNGNFVYACILYLSISIQVVPISLVDSVPCPHKIVNDKLIVLCCCCFFIVSNVYMFTAKMINDSEVSTCRFRRHQAAHRPLRFLLSSSLFG